MGTDMDLVMAYWELEKKSQHAITRKWVMGHADDKTKEKPDMITPIEHANIGCDKDANSYIESSRQSDVFEPLQGYKAMLQIYSKWVTTKFRVVSIPGNTKWTPYLSSRQFISIPLLCRN